MKNLIQLLSLLLLLSLANSCEKEIPFKKDASTSKLVLNGLFTSDSVWNIHLSHSLSVLDTGQLDEVANANVKIFNSTGNQVALLQYQDHGVYAASTEKPNPDETYRIEISAPGFTSISATDAIPGAVQIISLDTLTLNNPAGGQDLVMSITFTDPAGVSNFYMVEMLQTFIYAVGPDTFQFDYQPFLNCNDPNIETDIGFSFAGEDKTYEYILLKDQQIDGQTYTLDFTLRNWKTDPGSSVIAKISLISSSEGFFNYRKSFQAYQNTQGNPFAQPVQVYTNVENGYGIFAGGTRTVWILNY